MVHRVVIGDNKITEDPQSLKGRVTIDNDVLTESSHSVESVSIGTLSAYIWTLSGDIVHFKVHRVESGLFGAKLSSRIVQQSGMWN